MNRYFHLLHGYLLERATLLSIFTKSKRIQPFRSLQKNPIFQILCSGSSQEVNRYFDFFITGSGLIKNNMADDNVPTPAPTRSDEQILPFAAWVPIGKSNFVLDLHKKQKNPIFQIFVRLLGMIDPDTQFFRCLGGIIKSTNVDFAELIWEKFVQAIKTFLTDKANLSSPTKKGRKDKPHVIPYCRFTKLIICHLGRIHNIHQRLTSPFHLAEEDFRLGNLKCVPKGKVDEVFGMPIPNELISNNIMNAPYYNAYLEMVTKHDQKVATEKEGKKKTTNESGIVSGIRSCTSWRCRIQEPVAEAIRPLPVVEGKGKAIITDELGESVDEQVNLEEKTTELDQDQAGSDPGETHESRPLPEQPTHDEFMADLYPKIQESLKFPADEHVILKDPLSSTGTLSTEDKLGKLNVEAEVVSIVTLLIYQASFSVPLLLTPVIDLLLSKPASSTTQEPIFIATTSTTTTTHPLPPPPQQSITDSELAARVTALEHKFATFEQKSKNLDNMTQNLGSRVFTLEFRDLPHKIDEAVCENVKEAVQIALQAPLRDRFRDFPKADMKEMLHQRMFQTGSYKSLPEHIALYEALESSM
ncbi:hypothetical protein Tco_1103253 [Tanacetum coccineum]